MTGVVVSIISAGVAFIALIISIRSFFQGKKVAFQNEAQKLFSQKNEFLNGYMRIVSENIDDNIKEYLLSELASNYCNTFESACSLYLRKAIDQDLFKEVFIDELRSICSNDGIASGLEFPVSKATGDIYQAIRTVGKEWGIMGGQED